MAVASIMPSVAPHSSYGQGHHGYGVHEGVALNGCGLDNQEHHEAGGHGVCPPCPKPSWGQCLPPASIPPPRPSWVQCPLPSPPCHCQGLCGDDAHHLQQHPHQGPLLHLGVLLQSDLFWPLRLEEEKVHFLLGYHGLYGMVQDLMLIAPTPGHPAWCHMDHPRRDRHPPPPPEEGGGHSRCGPSGLTGHPGPPWGSGIGFPGSGRRCCMPLGSSGPSSKKPLAIGPGLNPGGTSICLILSE